MVNTITFLSGRKFTAERGIAQTIHHFASVEMAAVLSKAKTDVNARTPVGFQVRFGSADAVAFLLEQGAEPNGDISCWCRKTCTAMIHIFN